MGTPVVLIHGMWCRGEHLSRVAALLSARTYDCRLFTLPAHDIADAAEQERAVAALSINLYVDAAERFIAAQGFERPPVLVGHSMGGLIAQRLAARIDTTALVLLTPAAPAGIAAVKLGMLPIAWHLLGRLRFWKRPCRIAPEHARRSAVNGLLPQHQDRLIASLQAESGRAAAEMAFWWADSGKAATVSASAIRCPVYVVSAGHDGLTPPSVVRKVAARYAQSTLRHWPDRGHWVIDDQDTEEMVHEIDGWLRPILQRQQRGATRPLPRAP